MPAKEQRLAGRLMMDILEIARRRLYNQRITQAKFARPDQVVAWFGAMQAQDAASAKWAVGLRCAGADLAAIEQAIAEKRIVRTWLLRGTLHLAAADDARWLLALLAPRILAGSARRLQQLELDASTLTRSFEILTRALQGGKQLTRAAIKEVLEEAGVSTTGQRVYHILAQAALTGLICFGPDLGKQDTFVLLDEWVPNGRSLDHHQALAELARRYFTSHGPATLPDFIWWSGLKTADARAGLEAAKPGLQSEEIDGQTYWLPPNHPIPEDPTPTACLLPAFDEYYLGYQTRQAVLDPQYDQRAVSNNGVFRPMIVMDSQIVGIWKQTPKKDSVIIAPDLFSALTGRERQALQMAADQYGAFLAASATVAD